MSYFWTSYSPELALAARVRQETTLPKRKAERTVQTSVSFIYSLAKNSRRSPDLLGLEGIRQWLYYLIAERKQAPSPVNLAINAVRSFNGGLLRRDIEPLLRQIKRPRREVRTCKGGQSCFAIAIVRQP